MGMEIYAVRDSVKPHRIRSTRTLLRATPNYASFRLPCDPADVIFIHYTTNIVNCNRNHIEIP